MVCGVAYLILAYSAYSVAVEDKNSKAWRWVALFAVSQVISAWIGTLDHSVLHGSMGLSQMVTDWLGWAALAQFGRNWRVVDRSLLRGYWIYGVILVVAAGTFSGFGELAKSLMGVVVAAMVVPAMLEIAKNWPESSQKVLKALWVQPLRYSY